MRLFIRLAVALFLQAFMLASVNAQIDIYNVKVPLLDETEQSIKLAQQEAFAEVVARVTGQVTSWHDATIQTKRSDIDSYIDEISTAIGEGEEGSFLRIKFNIQAINQLLDTAALPVWSGIRPTVMAWVTVREESVSTILDNSDDATALTFTQEAQRRGIPLVLPLMDLVDLSRIEMQDIDSQAVAKLMKATQRYRGDVAIIASIQHLANDTWELQGSMLLPQGGGEELSVYGLTYEDLSFRTMEKVGARLTKIYASTSLSDATREIYVQVHGINNIQDYADVQEALRSVNRVEKLELMQAHHDTLKFLLQFKGNYTQLALGIDLVSRMERLSSTVNLSAPFDASTNNLDNASFDLVSQLEEEALELGLEEIMPPLLPTTETMVYYWN